MSAWSRLARRILKGEPRISPVTWPHARTAPLAPEGRVLAVADARQMIRLSTWSWDAFITSDYGVSLSAEDRDRVERARWASAYRAADAAFPNEQVERTTLTPEQAAFFRRLADNARDLLTSGFDP